MPDIDSLIEQIDDPALRDQVRAEIGDWRPAADRRVAPEYRLTYGGKESEANILLRTPAFPFQLTRAFGDLEATGWHNLLIQGDNLPALRRLVQMKKEGLVTNEDGTPGVRVVYIDPPFASEEDYETKAGKIAYSDKIKGAEFIEGVRRRLVLIREVLADDASVFVHLDWRKSHYIKVVMDEVFGEHKFRNEIVWGYSGGGVSRRDFPRKHDVILRYTIGPTWVFNTEYKPYKENTQAVGKHSTYVSEEKRTIDLDRGTPITDWWTDIPTVTGWSTEGVDFPTQKPEKLAARIIKAASNPGDIILDCFAGSGTALAAAEKLNRRWIGVDMGLSAIYTTQRRLLNVASSKALEGAAFDAGNPADYGQQARPFGVYSSGHYDFARLRALPFAEYRTFVLRLFGAGETDEEINGFRIDGRRRGDPVIVFNFTADPDAQVTPDFFPELAAVLGKRAGDRVMFIAPASRLAFLQDEISAGDINFEVRRVPYSMVNALRRRGTQPTSEADMGKLIESEGFDFAMPPRVERELDAAARTLTIKDFHSFGIAKGMTEAERGLPAIAMVLIDYDHDGRVFDLDAVVFAERLSADGYKVALDEAGQGKAVAVSICDVFGNEHIEVFTDQISGDR